MSMRSGSSGRASAQAAISACALCTSCSSSSLIARETEPLCRSKNKKGERQAPLPFANSNTTRACLGGEAELGFGLGHQYAECGLVVDRHVREDLAIGQASCRERVCTFG